MKCKLSDEEVQKAMDFMKKNPILVVVACIGAFKVLTEGSAPMAAWLKDCAPVNQPTAGPWRGKGSFGKSFGPNKVRHK